MQKKETKNSKTIIFPGPSDLPGASLRLIILTFQAASFGLGPRALGAHFDEKSTFFIYNMSFEIIEMFAILEIAKIKENKKRTTKM